MSNFAIDININAPALVGAIEHLCTALGKPVMLEAKPAGTAAKPELVQQPVQTTPVTPAAAPTVKTYTMDEIAKAAGDFMTPETIPQLQALLASFGVSGLPELPADKLAAFAAELRKMGAKI